MMETGSVGTALGGYLQESLALPRQVHNVQLLQLQVGDGVHHGWLGSAF